MDKSLDLKLARIRNGQYTPADFIIADAKDGDLAFGVCTAAPDAAGVHGSKEDHLQAMTRICNTGLVDIMLMSASSTETLVRRGVFNESPVTPAARMNDTTDIWMARGSRYHDSHSVPFASVDLEAVQPLCNLGLYSVTFSNHLDADLRTLEAYKAFRLQLRGSGFRHFLEVFNPAMDIGIVAAELGNYINDMIIKALAGVTSIDLPSFLKIQFNGAAAMSDLCRYDPEHLVVGILGGAKGTTRDTFELAHQAEQSGARVALFGRKINLAEAPHELVRLMRLAIEQVLTPEQAVRDYHHFLADQGITASRTLNKDLQITDPVLMQ